jgi:SulP family sulfate permease
MTDTSEEKRRFAVPGLTMIRQYDRSWLRPDLLAGLTVGAMLVPQALGYSTLAGMPSVNGLYAAFAAMIVYWLWGSSRELNVGPESTVAIMVATVLTPLAAAGTEEYVDLAATLAILVGLVLLLGGLFRLGKIADFLSRPILAGYVFGSGILIVVSQLPGLLGIEIDSSLYATEIGAVVRNLDQTHLGALAVGLGTVAVVMGFRRFAPAIPGALIAIIASVALVAFADTSLDVVGEFDSGVPLPSIPTIGLDDLLALIGPAFAIALLVYPDSVLTSRSLSVVNHYRLDANREFFGIGIANISAGLFQGFAVNGSQSRSFVASDSGARSQVANLWAALAVLATLLFLSSFFAKLPTATLAGIVIVAGIGLLGIGEFQALWRYRKREFWLAMITVAAVLLLGMLAGIVVAIGLSLLVVVLRSASPSTAILGRLEGTDTYRDIADHASATTVDGLLIFRFDAELYFANAGVLRDGILTGIDAADPPTEMVILDAESIDDIDSTGIQVMGELLDVLDERGIAFVMARVRTELRDELASTSFDTRLAGDGVYLQVDDAVTAFETMRRPTDPQE